MLQRFLNALARTLRFATRCALKLVIFAVTLFAVIALTANYLPISTRAKEFIMNDRSVTSQIGPMTTRSVVVHMLKATHSSDSLFVTATAVASGELGQVRVTLEGERLSTDDFVRFRVLSTQRVRCQYLYLCTNEGSTATNLPGHAANLSKQHRRLPHGGQTD